MSVHTPCYICDRPRHLQPPPGEVSLCLACIGELNRSYDEHSTAKPVTYRQRGIVFE